MSLCVCVRLLSGTGCLCLHLCAHVLVCLCVCVAVPMCCCVCVCPGAATSHSCRDSPAPPSLLSFIIICHEREPRRTVINKGHLKYKTTTLTLGNISSVEQLVPPLSLWKGAPGAASPFLASSDSPTPTLPAWDLEALGSLGRGAPESIAGRARVALSLPFSGALWKMGYHGEEVMDQEEAKRRLEDTGPQPCGVPLLMPCPS